MGGTEVPGSRWGAIPNICRNRARCQGHPANGPKKGARGEGRGKLTCRIEMGPR